jgi:ATP:ADP antiporter, AAA family
LSGLASRTITRLFKVEPAEWPGLAWSFLYFFALLAGYYVLRPVRDEMGVQSGLASLPWLMTATFLAMLAATPAFGWLAARYPRARMLPAVYAFFIVNLGVFFVAFRSGADPLATGRAFFVWLSVFNLFVVSVFWSFMTDLYSNAQAQRLFPVIAAGGSCGAIAGPALTQWLVAIVGIANLMLVSAAFLALCMVCMQRLGRWAAARGTALDRSATARADEAGALGGGVLAGIRLAFGSPYLLALCAYIFLLTWSSVVLWFEQVRIVGTAFADPIQRTQFFARVDMIVNVGTLVCQLFVTNRLIERFGLAVALLFLPLASVIGFLGMGWMPTLGVLVAFAVARRVGEYAISKPAREVLFTVLDREAKYKAKNFIDTAVTRGGEAASGWIVNGIKALGVAGTQLAFVAAPVALAWAGLGVYLARRHAQLAHEPAAPEHAGERMPARA